MVMMVAEAALPCPVTGFRHLPEIRAAFRHRNPQRRPLFSKTYSGGSNGQGRASVSSVMARANQLLRTLLVLSSLFTLPLSAANLTLKPVTLKAWTQYVQQAEARVDNATPLKLSTQRSSVVTVEPAIGSGTVAVPNGLIHDWIGTTFVPNITIAQLKTVLRDYDHYKDIYTPTVIGSKTLQTGDGTEAFSMQWFHKVMNITTGIDADYSNTEVQQGDGAGYMITRSTRIQEIRHLGEGNQQEMPVDFGSGFIWRICSMLRYQQADGGVYLRLEAIVLSRDIPHAFRWVANPIVNRISRSSLSTTLSQTGQAVETRSAALSGDSIARAR
jgi:hypothetical protein